MLHLIVCIYLMHEIMDDDDGLPNCHNKALFVQGMFSMVTVYFAWHHTDQSHSSSYTVTAANPSAAQIHSQFQLESREVHYNYIKSMDFIQRDVKRLKTSPPGMHIYIHTLYTLYYVYLLASTDTVRILMD